MASSIDQTTSVQSLKRFLRHAHSCGVECAPLLQAAGLDSVDLEDNSHRVATSALNHFLSAAINASHDPQFGLNASQHIQADTFDILGYIALNCSNLHEAMNKVIQYEKVSGVSGLTQLIDVGDQVLISWQCSLEDALLKRHTTENVIASWYRYAHQIVNITEQPKAIWFEHSCPDDVAAYRQLFQCETLFDQPYSGILIQRSQLDTPFPQSNSELLELLQQQADRHLQQCDSNQSTADKVTQLIEQTIGSGIPSKTLIAEKLGISGRTLQRQLEHEGHHYKDLLRDIRLAMANRYLQQTQFTIEEIAHKLGFTDARSFQRSYKQWTGKTPGSNRSA